MTEIETLKPAGSAAGRQEAARTLPGWAELLAAAVLLLAFLLPRSVDLGSFVTADEPTWGKRSASFYYALAHQDYPATYQTGHPGVTTMWAGAAAYYLRFPKYERAGQVALGDTKLLQIFQRQSINPMNLMATARLMVVLIVTSALMLAYGFARRLFPFVPTYTAFLLIAFDPFHVAHSRYLHTNGMLATFMFLALLAFLVFLRDPDRRIRRAGLAVSAAAAGLSYVCISPGFIIIPAIGLIALLDWFLRRRSSDGRRFHFSLPGFGREIVLPLAIWGALSLLVVYASWPAMWASPVETLSRMLRYGFSAAEGEIGGAQFVEAYQETTPVDADQGAQYLHFYPLTYLWRSTPVSLIGALLGLLFLIAGRRWIQPNQRRSLGYIFLFVAVYTLVMSLGSKKFDRYYLPVYLPLDVAAALGWTAALGWLAARFKALPRAAFPALALAVLVGVQAASTALNAPYYLTYYNPLAGGLKRAPQVMTIGWGEGLNEAAVYLHQQPGACDQRTLAWYPLAYSWYSIGFGCEAQLIDFRPQMTLQDYLSYDYAVIYINQMQRNYPPELLEYLYRQEPVHSVWIKGVEYVRIYKLPGAK